MQTPRTLGRSRSTTNLALFLRAIGLIVAIALCVCGCGGGSSYSSAPSTPYVPPAASEKIAGQYNLVLTSTSGHGTTNIYTNFAQTGTTLTGVAGTLVCPSNDVSQCMGDDGSVTPSGAVNGAKVGLQISFPTTAGADTVTMLGASSGSNLDGTYTDTQGDAGTWTGSSSSATFSGSYGGTFNSTVHPFPVDPTIMITLTEDSSFHLTGSAMITSSPCISALTLSGQAIGSAYSLTDAGNNLRITVVPTNNTVTPETWTFSYDFDSTATHCAGDLGRGQLTIQNSNPDPWGY